MMLLHKSTFLGVCLFCFSVGDRCLAQVVEVQDDGGNVYFVVDSTADGLANANYSEPSPFEGTDTGANDGWNGDRRWGNKGAATIAAWTFTDLANGSYDVFVSWKNEGQVNVNVAKYSGSDGFVTTSLNQRDGSAVFPGVVLNDGSNDVNFAAVGQVVVTDGTFTLEVDDEPTGTTGATFIFADAIAIRPVDGVSGGLTITEYSYSADRTSVTLTWESTPAQDYAVVFSEDLVDWSMSLAGVVTAVAGQTTSVTIDLAAAGIIDKEKVFFRIETRTP